VEVCTKFGGDWSRGSCVIEDMYKQSLLYIQTSQPGPGAAWEKFNAFFVFLSFCSSDLFGFWSLRYPRVRDSC